MPPYASKATGQQGVPSIATRLLGLAFPRCMEKPAPVWNQPYLETCCRSALHRLHLSGSAGRPPDLLDGACLTRIAAMGLCDRRADGRFAINAEGVRRHKTDVLTPGPVRTVAR
jgi:hypothetical protein